MKALGFFKKEIYEIVKTPKLIILPAVFLFFAMSSPLFAKYMNVLLEGMLKEYGQGGAFKLPEPTFFTSFEQLFENMNEIGIIVIILTFMGSVIDEKVKGSAVLVLTKGVSRMQFILSKFLAAVLFFAVTFSISVFIFIYYTLLLFKDMNSQYVWLAFLMLGIYFIFIIATTIFASVVSKSHMSAAVTGFLIFAATAAGTFLPRVGKYFPAAMGSLGLKIIQGANTAGDALIPIIVTLISTLLVLVCSILIFRRQEI